MSRESLLFLLLSGVKWGKLATTGGTMLLSIALYATIWGWSYAVGIVVLIMVHESDTTWRGASAD